MKKKSLYIFGSGGFASEIYDWFSENGELKKKFAIKGFISKDKKNFFLGRPVYAESKFVFKKNYYYHIAIGDIQKRLKIINFYKRLKFINIHHPSSVLSKKSKVGVGNSFGPNSVICSNTIVGDHNIIYYNSTISHDAKIGLNNFIGPGARLLGNSIIKNSNFFGANSILIQNIHIKKNSQFFKAGSIIKKNY